MTHSLTNRLTLPALLRDASGIDAPVKNSLCCAAAGITKDILTAAGVLIPHEKLREAAHIDAPLNAKNRPPAQPALGYIRFLLTLNQHESIARLMQIPGVGRKTAGLIHAACFQWVDVEHPRCDLHSDPLPVCHIAPRDIEYLQGGSDRHAVVRTGKVSKYKLPLYARTDTDEIEYWRSVAHSYEHNILDLQKERETALAHLVELSSLLFEWQHSYRTGTTAHQGLHDRTDIALTTKAQNSEPRDD